MSYVKTQSCLSRRPKATFPSVVNQLSHFEMVTTLISEFTISQHSTIGHSLKICSGFVSRVAGYVPRWNHLEWRFKIRGEGGGWGLESVGGRLELYLPYEMGALHKGITRSRFDLLLVIHISKKTIFVIQEFYRESFCLYNRTFWYCRQDWDC